MPLSNGINGRGCIMFWMLSLVASILLLIFSIRSREELAQLTQDAEELN
jgi:lipid-A-disaccharide synthase-like uncharacterized protein